MLGRPLEEARVILERDGAVADAADDRGSLGVVLGEGIPVLGRIETVWKELPAEASNSADSRGPGNARPG
jgi:hypothetical protein